MWVLVSVLTLTGEMDNLVRAQFPNLQNEGYVNHASKTLGTGPGITENVMLHEAVPRFPHPSSTLAE